MKMMSELIPLRLYSSNRHVFVPLDPKNKRFGSAIFLMSPDRNENEKMTHMPYLHLQEQYYKSYFIDRNVMTYIDSDAYRDTDEPTKFNELEEAALSEAMFHSTKAKLVIENGSTMDEVNIKRVLNNDFIEHASNMISFKKSVDKFVVKVHPSVADLQNTAPNYVTKTGRATYSYYIDNTIHILSYMVYDEKSMDGPYANYCQAELIACMIGLQYEINPMIAEYTGSALMQIDWLKEKYKKILKDDNFLIRDNDKKDISGLYVIDVIHEIYESKGPAGLRRFLSGDMNLFRQYSSKRVYKIIAEILHTSITEGTLSSKERNELKDKDFGLPEKRKYPMPDEAHVRSAIRFFNHCDKEDEEELASAIKAKIKKFKMKDVKVGKENRLSKYMTESVNESAAIDPNLEGYIDFFSDNGEPIIGNKSKDYLAVLQICEDLDPLEFQRISFYPVYRDSKYIKKRIVLYDPNGVPMSFMDVYNFPSSQNLAQITTAVARSYRGHHLGAKMLKMLLDSNFHIENGINRYWWTVHPGNEASEKIATDAGFKKLNDDLDDFGRYTYIYDFDGKLDDKFMPAVSESAIMLNENSGFYMSDQTTEVLKEDVANDVKFKKFLYKERLKNARAVIPIYNEIKSRNSNIERTYRELDLYKGRNLYVDTSYYHEMYLKNAYKGTKRALYMYFDFLSRLMENQEVMKVYPTITYFFPVKYPRNISNVESLIDWKQDFNVFSLIFYMARKDPEVLKRWAGKQMVFLGDNGYFKIDFGDFNTRNLVRLKKNLTRILSGGKITTDENPDDAEDYKTDDTTTSAKANVINALDRIENSTNIAIDDIGAIDTAFVSHLSMDNTMPKIDGKSTALFILAPNSKAVVSEIGDKALRIKGINSYYKSKI